MSFLLEIVCGHLIIIFGPSKGRRGKGKVFSSGWDLEALCEGEVVRHGDLEKILRDIVIEALAYSLTTMDSDRLEVCEHILYAVRPADFKA